MLTIVTSVACYWHQGFNVTYVNNTDEALCVSEFPDGASQRRSSYCDDIQAHDEVTYSHGYCDRPEELRWVRLLAGPEGERIYETLATCEKWQELDAVISVTLIDGRYVVKQTPPDVAD